MYCRACLDIFRVYHRRLVESKELTVHQTSAEEVRQSYSQGCCICTRLWDQFMTYHYRPYVGTNRYFELSTVYLVKPVEDKVQTIRGRDETDPYTERLSSSGLEYTVDFGWKGQWTSYMDRRDFLQYHVFAAEKLSKSLGDYVPSSRTDSAASWDLQKRWIKNCLENHPDCSTGTEDWFPTRVLDVGNENSSDVRLVESRTQPINRPYMTLSHSWGQAEVIKLTTVTVNRMRNGIPVSELPMLYQDAVKTCRQLGTRYLWIDSLCIIQDQELDWIREVAMMGQVYSNTLCNIEAAHAADGRGQLFFSRNEVRIKPLPVTAEWHKDGPLACLMIDSSVHRDNDMSDAPLQGRAWVLQEQLLASRTLIYSRTQVHWACRTQEASEMFPEGMPDLRRGNNLLSNSLAPRPLHLLKQLIASDDPLYVSDWSMESFMMTNPWREFWLSWRTIVLDYTSRALTFEKDKLAAIAGIASVIQRKIKTPYIAGMWNFGFYIEYELCWRAGNQANGQAPFRPKEYRAPTWSWASMEGSISYKYKTDYDLSGDTQLAFVEDAEVETVDGTPTGPVKSGLMRIEGPLIEEHNWAYYYPDDQADPELKTVFYLAMFALYCDQVWGLALRRLESGLNL